MKIDSEAFKDVMAAAEVGCWRLESDEGKPLRMYPDATMLKLIAVDEKAGLSPEEIYRAWAERIDPAHLDTIARCEERMVAGERAEMQYPWHHPDGRTMMVRCGGVRNPGYTKGIRIEGTHQNVSSVLHYDEAEMKRLRAREIELMHAEFRASVIAYLAEHEGDVKSFLKFFAGRLRELIKCDQVIYQNADGEDAVNSAPEFKDIKFDPQICGRCPHHDYHSPIYSGGVTELEDHLNCTGEFKPPKECPVKSSLVRIVSLNGKPSGYLAIHYISGHHAFTDYERRTLEEFTDLLSLSLSRFADKEKNAELQRELKLKQQIAA